MANLFFLSLLLFQYFLASSLSQSLVPALYIFGDCQVDSGINLELNITSSKANYYPYGIDFPIGSTGRFTNGATIADLIAEKLGLQVSIHYSPTKSSSNQYLTGYNYASGPAGILPETGTAYGVNWSMDKQVEVFNMTVQNTFPKHFRNKTDMTDYLSKSLFVIASGTSDYRYNFMQPNLYNTNKRYNPDQYASLLVNRFGKQLKELYKLGARRFLVFELVPLGCYPGVLKAYKPTTGCAEEANHLTFTFNRKLDHKVRALRSTHKDVNIIIAKTYSLILGLVERPLYGFLETKRPCCLLKDDSSGLCAPNDNPCRDRNTTLFWDDFHLTEAANRLIVERCFSGSGVCEPNLRTSLSSKQPRLRPCSVHLLFLLTISGLFLLSQEYWVLQLFTTTFTFIPTSVRSQL